MPTITLRPGLLDRAQRMSGLITDRALAGALGVTEKELADVRAGGSPSAEFLAGLGDAFGFTLGEIAEVRIETSKAVAA